MPWRDVTIGKLLLEDALPPGFSVDNPLDKRETAALLRRVAEEHPEKYREVSKKLADIGRRVAHEEGGASVGVNDLRTSAAALAVRARLQPRIKALLTDPRLSDKQRREAIIRATADEQDAQTEAVFAEALAAKNPLAMQVMSGARGNKTNVSNLLGSPMLYTDQRGDVLPIPILHNYSEGLSPAEHWASAYGARQGVLSVKFNVRDSGALSKQLNQIAHRLVVAGDDDPEPGDTLRGMPVETDDPDNEGALLAHDIGSYAKHTHLTPKVLKDLKRRRIDHILVRSPIVGGSPEGGVWGRDVGVREKGVMPGRGEQVGMTAMQAISEQLSQSGLSAKHSGGVSGANKSRGAFAILNQLTQIPKTYTGGAAHATADGTVDSIAEAPAGGNFLTIGGKKHYVAAGYGLKVKLGDEVEAGDVLSEGLPNPDTVVEHKGIGEGRRYFTQAFRRAAAENGIRAHRRNSELLSRGLINHVILDEEMGDHNPDDIVPYSSIEKIYKPRLDAADSPLDRAADRYLEKPYLHYSVGTKVRPSVLRDLERFGIQKVVTHQDPPPFRPQMIRAMGSIAHDPDWMTRMYGSGQKASLLEAVHRGRASDEHGSSFVPGLARAVDFGRQGLTAKPGPGKHVEGDLSQEADINGNKWSRLLKLGADGLTEVATQPKQPKQPAQQPQPGIDPTPKAVPTNEASAGSISAPPGSSGGVNAPPAAYNPKPPPTPVTPPGPLPTNADLDAQNAVKPPPTQDRSTVADRVRNMTPWAMGQYQQQQPHMQFLHSLNPEMYSKMMGGMTPDGMGPGRGYTGTPDQRGMSPLGYGSGPGAAPGAPTGSQTTPMTDEQRRYQEWEQRQQGGASPTAGEAGAEQPTGFWDSNIGMQTAMQGGLMGLTGVGTLMGSGVNALRGLAGIAPKYAPNFIGPKPLANMGLGTRLWGRLGLKPTLNAINPLGKSNLYMGLAMNNAMPTGRLLKNIATGNVADNNQANAEAHQQLMHNIDPTNWKSWDDNFATNALTQFLSPVGTTQAAMHSFVNSPGAAVDLGKALGSGVGEGAMHRLTRHQTGPLKGQKIDPSSIGTLDKLKALAGSTWDMGWGTAKELFTGKSLDQ